VEEGVLLRFVEPVNLVDEKDGPFAAPKVLDGSLDDVSYLFYARENC
jgi:hypothetical protein